MTSEKRALVLELGSRYVRAGIAEERAPRFVLRWEVAELLQAPRSAAAWRELLYPKLHALCFESMLVNPSRRRVILCEDLLCPRTFREALLAIFFTDFKVASVIFVPSVVTALYATSNHTALVIDCGWSETRVLPIFKGFPLQYLYRTIPNGSKNCCDTIQREVGGGVSVVGTEMAEDILERACFAQQKVHSASN